MRGAWQGLLADRVLYLSGAPTLHRTVTSSLGSPLSSRPTSKPFRVADGDTIAVCRTECIAEWVPAGFLAR